MVAGYLSRTSSTLQIRGGWMLLTLSRINHTVALPDKHFVDDTDTGQDNDHEKMRPTSKNRRQCMKRRENPGIGSCRFLLSWKRLQDRREEVAHGQEDSIWTGNMKYTLVV